MLSTKKPVFSGVLGCCCSCVIAAEQKARATYDNILRLADDPDVIDVIRFLREREIVHYQRFGEAKRKDTSKAKKEKVMTDKKTTYNSEEILYAEY